MKGFKQIILLHFSFIQNLESSGQQTKTSFIINQQFFNNIIIKISNKPVTVLYSLLQYYRYKKI